MIFPDQSHINRIREALWQRPAGCASLMIGAGFSRNAIKSGPSAREFPIWKDLSDSLCSKLYPPGDSVRRDYAIAEAVGTDGFLRLAQEYEAAFGRSSLHRLIQRLVPDDDYNPGDIHTRFLRLPWRDVYTTNWDTLLERARRFVADRAYGVVRTFEEIPSTPQPRIIKLHGSFPAHFPLIITEEDYRTYPRQFAPFVNTVQQGIMETILCLIGFSGDDPNFLHWSGWVRDNLGESAPKIYLAGWLDLSPHRRRMLEARNVVPVDLAIHPKANSWPEHLRHQYATDWLLYSFERGKPYETTEWPWPKRQNKTVVPEVLMPVEEVTINSPLKEPAFPNGEKAKTGEAVKKIIAIWKHNRKVYPGWLFIPPQKHIYLNMDMDRWERLILSVISDYSIPDRLFAIREMVWRREHQLDRLPSNILMELETVLYQINCQEQKLCDKKDNSAPWSKIRESVLTLKMVLLTNYRLRLNRSSFEACIEELRFFIDDSPEVSQKIYHEQCLWELTDLNYEALDRLLEEWKPENCDPMWMTRKAAILVEADRDSEAVTYLNNSLSILRDSCRLEGDLAAPSREGWTLHLALAFERGFTKSLKNKVDTLDVFARWQKLGPLECDAFEQKKTFLNYLEKKNISDKPPPFDFGIKRESTLDYSTSENRMIDTAWTSIRLCEVAGLPPYASNTMVGAELINKACEILVSSDFALVSRLTLRVGQGAGNDLFDRVWTRTRIASILIEEVSQLVDLANNFLDYAIPKVTNSADRPLFWISKVSVVLEALSRILLRLPSSNVEKILDRGLEYYRNKDLVKHFEIAQSINNLLKRAWETLPTEKKSDEALNVLSLPIVGFNGFDAHNALLKDPGELFSNNNIPSPARTPETERNWVEIIQLVIRGLKAGEEPRKSVASRVAPLVSWGNLTETENLQILDALWGVENNQPFPDNLPGGTMFLDWVFLWFPEPKPGLAVKLFREKWLSGDLPGKKGINEFLWHLGMCLSGIRHRKLQLILTDKEQDYLADLVEFWVALETDGDVSPWDRWRPREGIMGLEYILPEIHPLPPDVSKKLFIKVSELSRTSTPGFALIPGILQIMPERFLEIVDLVRIGLAAENSVISGNAVLGLHRWLADILIEGSQIPEPPSDLLREVGLIVATRRKGALVSSLQLIKMIFSHGTQEQRQIVKDLTAQGLGYLIEELRYDREYAPDEELDIPLLRWCCIRVALSMTAARCGDETIVTRWVKLANDDPLPEIRNAESIMALEV